MNSIFDYILIILGAVMFSLVAIMVLEDPKPKPQPKTQLVTLEDGTKCVVLKGFYSDNAITCDWNK